ncbi:uncharacterized protein KY384_003402 [Bacidia gigantensis]|uniref:uncharacterized protein n=1 Tax=Bacidia gigantensis TaxID=2732470 RepID=UPI001D0474DC|nr:uncharacterized protein KY384_003402 [Bacidia gigantensis]KAG8531766.1 hypothetical protein KY384_003402 [Bacidia gigantensis]
MGHWVKRIGPKNAGLVHHLLLQFRGTANGPGNQALRHARDGKFCCNFHGLELALARLQPHHALQTVKMTFGDTLHRWDSKEIAAAYDVRQTFLDFFLPTSRGNPLRCTWIREMLYHLKGLQRFDVCFGESEDIWELDWELQEDDENATKDLNIARQGVIEMRKELLTPCSLIHELLATSAQFLLHTSISEKHMLMLLIGTASTIFEDILRWLQRLEDTNLPLSQARAAGTVLQHRQQQISLPDGLSIDSRFGGCGNDQLHSLQSAKLQAYNFAQAALGNIQTADLFSVFFGDEDQEIVRTVFQNVTNMLNGQGPKTVLTCHDAMNHCPEGNPGAYYWQRDDREWNAIIACPGFYTNPLAPDPCNKLSLEGRHGRGMASEAQLLVHELVHTAGIAGPSSAHIADYAYNA